MTDEQYSDAKPMSKYWCQYCAGTLEDGYSECVCGRPTGLPNAKPGVSTIPAGMGPIRLTEVSSPELRSK
jgi:hypothetical protein